jgi:6-phosphofructokinase
MRIGVLTGGGDCPGLNAVIRAVVRKGVAAYGHEFVGFRDGWKGPLEGLTKPLGIAEVRGILPRGGTILGSSRTNPFKVDGGVDRIKANLAEQGVDALVAIGGEDTLGVATKLNDLGVNVVGVPKTIDNDALHAGLAGGANVILLPERNFDVEQVATYVTKRFQVEYAPIVVVAEGAQPLDGQMTVHNQELDAFGHVRLGGIGQWLAEELESRTGKEARTVVLGHIQRGGTPTAFDRVLATRFGLQAIDAVHEGDFGKMMALRGTDIVRVPLIEGTGELKTVPLSRYEEAEVFFGS